MTPARKGEASAQALARTHGRRDRRHAPALRLALLRRAARIAGILLMCAGVLMLSWTIVVWRWQDPFTALQTHWRQERLNRTLKREFASFRAVPRGGADAAAEQRLVRAEAARFRHEARRGQAIGRIIINRVGLNMVLVNGTDEDSLKSGPGRDPHSYMPGENRLVYIAGHRTTYLAPFSHIDTIRAGDLVRIEMPYAAFDYHVYAHRIVPADDVSVLRSPRHELLELQACHPRFFATHRYVVYARLVKVDPRRGRPYQVASGPLARNRS